MILTSQLTCCIHTRLMLEYVQAGATKIMRLLQTTYQCRSVRPHVVFPAQQLDRTLMRLRLAAKIWLTFVISTPGIGQHVGSIRMTQRQSVVLVVAARHRHRHQRQHQLRRHGGHLTTSTKINIMSQLHSFKIQR